MNRKNDDKTQWQVPPREVLKKHRKKLRRATAEKLSKCEAEAWDEKTTEFDKELVIDATTFNVERVMSIPPARLEGITDKHRYVVSPQSTFAYQNRIISVGTPLKLHNHGMVFFTDDVTVPMLIDLQRDSKGDRRS